MEVCEMNDLYTYPINDYRIYLQHHGVQGQKWGVRNAEWYPIAAYKAHLARMGGNPKNSARVRSNEGGIFFKKKKKKTPEPTINDLKNPRNVRTLRSPYENEVRDNIKTRQDQIRKDNELMMKFRNVQEKMNKGEELSESDKVTYLRYTDPDANKRYEDAVKAENKRIRDKNEKERLNEKQKEIMSKGTLDEILKLAGIADNKEVANAIRNRVDLTKALQEVGAEEKSKFNKFIENADKTVQVAKKVSELAREGYKAYDDSRKLLQTLGFIPKDSNSTNIKGRNLSEVSEKILKKALGGQLSTDEVKKYNDYVNQIANLQRNAFGGNNNSPNAVNKQNNQSNQNIKKDKQSGPESSNTSNKSNNSNTSNSSPSRDSRSMQDIVNYAKGFTDNTTKDREIEIAARKKLAESAQSNNGGRAKIRDIVDYAKVFNSKHGELSGTYVNGIPDDKPTEHQIEKYSKQREEEKKKKKNKKK